MRTVVVGGGIAGLTTATLLARGGRAVTLYEKSQLGGRAASSVHCGAVFDQGPHALCRKGRGRAVLRRLGIDPIGHVPRLSGDLAWRRNRLHALPVGPASLMTTSLLNVLEKVELARALTGLRRLPASELGLLTFEEWLHENVRFEACRELIRAFVRFCTYAGETGSISASAAIGQLQLVFAGSVLHVCGGWQRIVDALRQCALAAGVNLVEGTRVDAVRCEPVRTLMLANGQRLEAEEVVLAVPPRVAADLTASPALRRWAALLGESVRAACLELAVRRLTRPRARFALGIDRPLFFSVRSTENSAPQVVHVARHLASGEDGRDVLSELEGLADAMQPGWRATLAFRRFLPEMIVSHALPTAAGRPGVDAAGAEGVYVAGDWVGARGMLSDAALSSAEEAAERILSPPTRLETEA